MYGKNRLSAACGTHGTPHPGVRVRSVWRRWRAMSRRRPDPEPITPRAFADVLNAHLREHDANRGIDQKPVYEVIARFGEFVEKGLGIHWMEGVGSGDVQLFVDSCRPNGSMPTYAIRRARRRSLRLAFRVGLQLQIVRFDATRGVELGPSPSVRARPLTDDEIALGRRHSFNSLQDLRRPIAWALAEATARTTEIGVVRVRDVDLERGTVQLPGCSSTDPRLARLSDWGCTQLGRRLEHDPGPDGPLVVWRRPPRNLRSASAQAMAETLMAAGINAPDVRPLSVAAWAGRCRLKDGASIDEVARQLGMRSLDQVALLVGFDWRSLA